MLTPQPISVLICALKTLTFMEKISIMVITLACKPVQLLDFLLTLSLGHVFLSAIPHMDYMDIRVTGDATSYVLQVMEALLTLNAFLYALGFPNSSTAII
jgi:hypothetical protein